jgi:hypothetical protein
MLDILKRQKYGDRIPQQLPEGTDVAHKTGSIRGVRNDAGIVYAPAGPTPSASSRSASPIRSPGSPRSPGSAGSSGKGSSGRSRGRSMVRLRSGRQREHPTTASGDDAKRRGWRRIALVPRAKRVSTGVATVEISRPAADGRAGAHRVAHQPPARVLRLPFPPLSRTVGCSRHTITVAARRAGKPWDTSARQSARGLWRARSMLVAPDSASLRGAHD